ncbi:DHHW family protein [Paenibacillus sp. N1-5-1-14]|uniref:DHHW family protein n=1 Tax=Paenibacillus radicibacter TaxID=2972488 RepID=UPI002159337B|nr:DHHW family protein [Paenibacillus radicibacter]MCR8644243.1 DHHW family protein [Paenibacillus radicibacter]
MEKRLTYTHAVTVILLLLSIGTIFVLNIVTPSRHFSESENRVLKQLPEFSWQSLMSGKFTNNYETYISDQFAARDLWIGVKSSSDLAIGKKENNGVYAGRDGYLIQQFTPPNRKDLNDKVQAINSFASEFPDLNQFMMLVPTAISVLPEKLPNHVFDLKEMKYRDLVHKQLNSNIRIIDVFPALRAQKEQPIYYKTDHHWTTRGAYYAYHQLAKDIGFEPQDESSFDVTTISDEFFGTLYSKSGFRNVKPDPLEIFVPKSKEDISVEYVEEAKMSDSLYEMDHLNKKDKYAVFLNGNHALVRITTKHQNAGKLLIVKDSYANSLVPFLTAHYSEIDVVDLRYFERDLKQLIQDRQIDTMLTLYNVQTFMTDESIRNLTYMHS